MNITLIGMPGAGKSFVGKTLAQKLGFEFIELDAVLEHEYGCLLSQIVEKLGEENFLNKEAEIVVSETKDKDGCVISPGGSVVYRIDAMQHFKNISTIIYLDVPQEILERRIGDTPRGIVGAGEKSFSELYSERTELYRTWSDYIIDGDKDVGEIISDVIRVVWKN